jgi:hypothetical protein
VSAGRIVMVVLGSLVALIGLALLAAGGVALWANETQRDADGFFTTPTIEFASTRNALVSDGLDTNIDGFPLTSDVAELGPTVRLRATSVDTKPLFIGIARERDVEAYLAGVARDVVTDLNLENGESSVEYRPEPGTRMPAPPGEQEIWVAAAEGTGTQTVEWDATNGSYSAVAMNADGSPGIELEMTLGAKITWLIWVAVGLLVGGALLFGLGGLLVYLGAKPSVPAEGAPVLPSEAAPAGADEVTAAPLPGAEGYPVQVEGSLAQPPGRWLWLVKWILAIPHWIVLTFLWIAFVVMTIVAFFAILITGRYPRGIFDFNVGVLRWSWRVGFYTYSALGTDRYPPFSLGPEPGYPAALEVPYPERLSRGLVLVKWWLLAIPHYIVVAVFEGGWGFTNAGWGWGAARWGDADWTFSFPGLIGILVIISAIALLFTGRYPRDLFDFVIGMNRWVWRVVAYATLMRDEYPPFRLGR